MFQITRILFCLPCAFIFFSSVFGEELGVNLVLDGGCEEWIAIGPEKTAAWNYLTAQCKDTEFSKSGNGNILLPKIHSLINEGCKLLKMEDKDVHSGQKALRQNLGNIYLSPSSPDAFKTKDGDMYVIRFWAKGEGAARIYLHVYGDGNAEFLSEKGSLKKDEWSPFEERVLVTGRAPTFAVPRLTASKEILFDEIFVGKVMREDDRKLITIPSDCQERVAFASDAEDKIVIDGKLDEPVWNSAVEFCGFRSYTDQSCLAPSSPGFKVMHDDNNIYFGVEIPLAGATQVRQELQSQPLLDGKGTPLPKNDTYTARESAELFLQPPDSARYFQFVASLDGYRFEGAGKDASWNGAWETAAGTAEDRWFCEIRIPLKELGVEKLAPEKNWRINVCANQSSGVSTWAAVGVYFHNPDAFGTLIMTDFTDWCARYPEQVSAARKNILDIAEQLGRSQAYGERLKAVESYADENALKTGSAGWEEVTKAYARLNYVDFSLRCMIEELDTMKQLRQGKVY